MAKEMMLRSPKISIIIAVYNKEAYLRESIESVLGQNFKDYELICVDAASTDGSLQVLREYVSKDSRIKVYKDYYTEIPAVTKNYGIDRSIGEYVFLLDADDYLSINALSNMYWKAKETSADAVVPDLQVISTDKKYLESRKSGLNGNRNVALNGREAVTQSLDWSIHGFALWNVELIRRQRLEEFGAYSDEYSARTLFFNCGKVAFSEGSYFYRMNPLSLTGKISLKTYDRPSALCRIASFLDKNGFEQKDVCSYYFSAFKDCCYLMYMNKELNANERPNAEKKIKMVYDIIDKGKVRKSVFAPESGKAEIWKIEGKFKKYFVAVLSLFNWRIVKKISSKIFF